MGKDVTGAAICELHQRLRKVEQQSAKPATTTISQSQTTTAPQTVQTEKPTIVPAAPEAPTSAVAATAGKSKDDQRPTDTDSMQRYREQSPESSTERSAGEQSVRDLWRDNVIIPPAFFAGSAELEPTEDPLASRVAESGVVMNSPSTLKWIAQEGGGISPPAGGSERVVSARRMGLDQKAQNMSLPHSVFLDDKGYTYPSSPDSGYSAAGSKGERGTHQVEPRVQEVQKRRISGVNEMLYGLRVAGYQD